MEVTIDLPDENNEKEDRYSRKSSIRSSRFDRVRHTAASITQRLEDDIRRRSYRFSVKLEETLNIEIKRERNKSMNKEGEVKLLRQNLPLYNLSEIRKFRLPLHEALIMNLKEGGFPSTAKYINELIDFQDNIRKNVGPSSALFVLPQLKFAKNELSNLTNSLKAAEMFHNENQFSGECEEVLNIGLEFAFGENEWWWLGEQILIQAVQISTSSSSEIHSKFEALSRYIYGKFLFEKIVDYELALKQLTISRHLSRNKIWTTKRFFPDETGTLYIQTNKGIFECGIKKVKDLIKTDPETAMILADQARKRATEACFKDGETRAFVLKGICELETKRPKSAINSFLRALNIQEHFGTIEGMCKIRIHLAKAYLMDNCTNSSLNTLMELKRDAELHDLPFYLGQAYKNLGEYYLLIGDPSKASPLLDESLKIFNQCSFKSLEAKTARNLKAISGGLQLFSRYVEILLGAGTGGASGKNNLNALIDWKAERKDFWTDQDHIFAYSSCDEIIKESLMKVAYSRANILDAKLRNLATQSAIKMQKNITSATEEIKPIFRKPEDPKKLSILKEESTFFEVFSKSDLTEPK